MRTPHILTVQSGCRFVHSSSSNSAHVQAAAVLGDSRHELVKLLLQTDAQHTDAALCDAALSRCWASALPGAHHHDDDSDALDALLARIQLVRRVRATAGASSRSALRALSSLCTTPAPAALPACLPATAANAATSPAAATLWLVNTATDEQVADVVSRWSAVRRAQAAAAVAPNAALAAEVLAERTLEAEQDDSLFFVDTLGDTHTPWVEKDENNENNDDDDSLSDISL